MGPNGTDAINPEAKPIRKIISKDIFNAKIKKILILQIESSKKINEKNITPSSNKCLTVFNTVAAGRHLFMGGMRCFRSTTNNAQLRHSRLFVVGFADFRAMDHGNVLVGGGCDSCRLGGGTCGGVVFYVRSVCNLA